jgi:phage anti-repressor protein
MRAEMENGNPPNIQPIGLYPDGMIDYGHTRFGSGKLAGAIRLKAEYTTSPYPNKEKLKDTITNLTKSNIHRELKFSVKLDWVNAEEYGHKVQHGFEMDRDEKLELYKKVSIAERNVKRGREIQKYQPGLLKNINNGLQSIEAAWKLATGQTNKIIPKKKNGIDLYKLHTPEMQKRIISYAVQFLKAIRSTTVKTKEGPVSPICHPLGWEKSRFTGSASDTFMWSHGMVLQEEGYNVSTANGHPTDPDVFLIDEDEKMEIKTTKFKGQGSGTTWKGGNNIREGEYLLIAHDENFTRLFMVFTTLYKEDWDKQGNMGTLLKLNKWWKNKKNTNDYEFWKGEVYEAGGMTQMTLENID